MTRHTLTQLGKRLLIGSLPILAILITWPATPAHADTFGFDTVCSTISGMLGGAVSGISQAFQSIQSMEQTTIWPAGAISQTQANIGAIVNSYRGWMSQVYTQPLSSAQQPSASQLETLLHSGVSSGTPMITSSYQATYGSPAATAGASLPTRQTTDMSDAHAIDGLSLATATDQSATNLISLAHQLEDQSATTAPGTAEAGIASALALQLTSLAAQHQLLASELRQEAGLLAQETSDMKQAGTGTQNGNNILQNLFKTKQ